MKRRSFLGISATLLTASLAGCIDGARETVDEYRADAPGPIGDQIDASAEDLQLEASHFDETGWEYLGSGADDETPDSESAPDNATDLEGEDGESSIRYFLDHSTGAMVITIVGVYDKVSDSRDAFDEAAGEITEQYSTEELSFGEEGIGYATNHAMAVFREANVIGIVAYEPGSDTLSVDDAAEIGALMHESWP